MFRIFNIVLFFNLCLLGSFIYGMEEHNIELILDELLADYKEGDKTFLGHISYFAHEDGFVTQRDICPVLQILYEKAWRQIV